MAPASAVCTVRVDDSGPRRTVDDADGDLEKTFDADDVSGVSTNDDDSVLTVTVDTSYELQAGDRLHLRYEGANNPDAAGEYDVRVRINDAGWTAGTFAVGG